MRFFGIYHVHFCHRCKCFCALCPFSLVSNITWVSLSDYGYACLLELCVHSLLHVICFVILWVIWLERNWHHFDAMSLYQRRRSRSSCR
ncbi:hypothetical protein AQUCO_01800049v1 [Aquilegia coerulea]|uniref:Uncharacterized protein n=1 Tax=Aquilegia coerulea TaxID=218851 RepID=A0A2G5DJT7_AQUCA|nr:hypothetical protein AQUCO_01800049v1 [Aquilegia coerulea]